MWDTFKSQLVSELHLAGQVKAVSTLPLVGQQYLQQNQYIS